MGKKSYETFGKLLKKETFRSVENETFSDKLILENTEPYPGYHGTTVPDSLEADSLFVITNVNYNDDRLIRAIQTVKPNVDVNFNGATGTVKYQNKAYNFIRFKFLPYNKVGEVLKHFEKIGIDFRKHRKVAPYESLIEVRKFFKMEEKADGIYQDKYDKNTSYLLLPTSLTWHNFEKITMGIKYNMDDINFDCAQTSIYCEDGFMDFVRLYDEESSVSKLKHIRNKYLEAVSYL
jgi:hypothetical protein